MGKSKLALSGQLADMDLKLLRIFKTVAECGGVAAAEDELNIAPSTISNYLADLEQRLGMTLCLRGRRGFSLTEQGQSVYSAINELLAALEQFQGRIRGTRERLIGDLSLGIAENALGPAGLLIQRSLDHFIQTAPEVYIDLHMLVAEEVSRGVREERLAVGLSYAAGPIQGLELRPLLQEPMLLYCAEGHPLYDASNDELTIERIEQQRFVGTPRLKQGQGLQTETRQWHFQGYAPHVEGRALLIRSGHFLGYLPQYYAEASRQQSHPQPRLRALLPEQLGYSNTFYAMTRKNSYLSPVAEAFIERLSDSLGQDAMATAPGS